MIKRLTWVVFILLWILTTFLLVIPFIYWVITGNNWIDPEVVYNKLFEEEES